MAELKPCPFCGGEALGEERYWNSLISYRVFCTKCFSETREFDDKEQAIEAWNKRS